MLTVSPKLTLLLRQYRKGKISEEELLKALALPPIADLGFAQVDLQRETRKGFPEVIFGAGKTPSQIVSIARQIFKRSGRVLITRVSPEQAGFVTSKIKEAVYHEPARAIVLDPRPLNKRPGSIAVVSAGTSDMPVAEEAALTAEVMGNRVQRFYDAGVAGIHRLLKHIEAIRKCNVVVVVAGMEGALPSVVAGLIKQPIIAVPTSVGYGASFYGLAALLAMLNSCGSGVTVVNIDNGFGAGYAASQINTLGAC